MASKVPMTKNNAVSISDSQHLFDAVRKGKIHLTRFILVASPCKLQNAWDKDGTTPLIACTEIKEETTRDQLVHILLESGADVNMTDKEGRSPLMHACQKKCNDIVRILIHHHNVKPDLMDRNGDTALIYSAAAGNDVATELLIRNFRRLGLQIDHFNKEGNTALLLASRLGNLHCARILAQRGRACLTLRDKEHSLLPFEWCLNQGYQKEEVDFLRPTTRFYRVAKLATTLTRSQNHTSVSSIETNDTKLMSFKSMVKGRKTATSLITPKVNFKMSTSELFDIKKVYKSIDECSLERQQNVDMLPHKHTRLHYPSSRVPSQNTSEAISKTCQNISDAASQASELCGFIKTRQSQQEPLQVKSAKFTSEETENIYGIEREKGLGKEPLYKGALEDCSDVMKIDTSTCIVGGHQYVLVPQRKLTSRKYPTLGSSMRSLGYRNRKISITNDIKTPTCSYAADNSCTDNKVLLVGHEVRMQIEEYASSFQNPESESHTKSCCSLNTNKSHSLQNQGGHSKDSIDMKETLTQERITCNSQPGNDDKTSKNHEKKLIVNN